MDKRTQEEIERLDEVKLDKAEAKPYFSILQLVGKAIALGVLGVLGWVIKKTLGL